MSSNLDGSSAFITPNKLLVAAIKKDRIIANASFPLTRQKVPAKFHRAASYTLLQILEKVHFKSNTMHSCVWYLKIDIHTIVYRCQPKCIIILRMLEQLHHQHLKYYLLIYLATHLQIQNMHLQYHQAK